MNYSLRLYTAPTAEPITLQEAKDHLRIVGTDEDVLITRLITAARHEAETITNRAIYTQTWELTFDQFPLSNEPIYLPKPPLQSVTHVKYLDTNGTEQTWTSTNYRVGTYHEPAEITLAYGQSWPTVYAVRDAVTIRYVCGYGVASAVPNLLKQGMLLTIGSMYEQREDVITGTIVQKSDRAAIDIYQLYAVGDEFHRYSCSY